MAPSRRCRLSTRSDGSIGSGRGFCERRRPDGRLRLAQRRCASRLPSPMVTRKYPVGFPFISGSTTGLCSMPFPAMLAASAAISASGCAVLRTLRGDFLSCPAERRGRCRWLLARHGGFPHQGQRNNFRPVRCGVRRARAEVAAYADCTESQMMAMFGWTDPKMPAHYIAQANRERLGISGIEKMVTFDQSQSLEHWLTAPRANGTRTPSGNGVVTFPVTPRKKPNHFNVKCGFVVRSEGLEPPRFYSLPPQGSASTNSATSALGYRPEGLASAGSTAPM